MIKSSHLLTCIRFLGKRESTRERWCGLIQLCPWAVKISASPMLSERGVVLSMEIRIGP